MVGCRGYLAEGKAGSMSRAVCGERGAVVEAAVSAIPFTAVAKAASNIDLM